jgi:hypothetical protein
MTWYFNTAMKFVHDTVTAMSKGPGTALELHKCRQLACVPWAQWTRDTFLQGCDQLCVLDRLRATMVTYNKKYPVKVFNGLFQDATATQIDICRLAALMVEPCMFTFLAEKSDPGQDRTHANTTELRAAALAQACLQELQRLHNDVTFVPQAVADISMWSDMFIPIAQPADWRDYGWISSTFLNIKKQMGIYMANFTASGELANDQNDHARDTQFFTSFIHKQPLWMYIYLLWDHGRDASLAWNAILLPDTQAMDIGADQAPAARPPPTEQPPPKKKRRGSVSSDADPLLTASTELLSQLRSNASTASTTITSVREVPLEVSVAEKAAALSAHADIIKAQLKTLPEECQGMKDKLTSTLHVILTQLCEVRVACCLLRAACCVMRAACCVLRDA